MQGATQNMCIAQEAGVCIYQRYRSKYVITTIFLCVKVRLIWLLFQHFFFHLFVYRVMHPQIQTVDWIQCDRCQKWLHADCAGISIKTVTEQTSFKCGCDEHVHTFEK